MNNKLIKKFADEAEFSEKDLHIQNDNFQKFAKLIVQECAEIAGRDVGHFILEHFEIE